MPVVTRQVRVVRILLRKRLGPQEHQVFTEMGTSWKVIRVFQMTHTDIEGRCGFVCVRVGDDDAFELVGQGEQAVRSSFGRRQDERGSDDSASVGVGS